VLIDPMINWIFYPKSVKATELAVRVVQAFDKAAVDITSETHELKSDDVLAAVAPHLESLGFRVESGKKADQKIQVPVLFGQNGKLEKSFFADAYHESEGFVIEVEAGRGFVNYQFLKDLFQACMMHDVFYLAIATHCEYGEA